MADIKKMSMLKDPHHMKIASEHFWMIPVADKDHLIKNMDDGVWRRDNKKNLPERLSTGKAFSAFCRVVRRQIENYKNDTAYPCFDCMRIAKNIGLISDGAKK